MASTSQTQPRQSALNPLSEKPRVDASAVLPACLAVFAAFCTGAGQEWAYAVFIAGLGFLMALQPRVNRLALWPTIFLFLFWLWPLLGFTPAHWWPVPEWRTTLQKDLGIDAGPFLTPQPALTLEHWFFLSVGICWLYALTTYNWSREQRAAAIKTYCLAITAMACLALACELLRWRPPFWDANAHFGPFANRNQTANLLAIAGILILACDYQDAANRQRWSFMWFLCLGIVTAAIVQTHSRAGILLFFGGAAVWTVWLLLAARSAARLSLAITALLLLLSFFFIFGGKTLERFTQANRQNTNPGALRRWQVQRDALHMSGKSTFAGYGLGNFADVFVFYRDKSVTQDRVIHPESDYLWLVAEAGWPALFWGAGLFLAFLPRWRHLRQHTDYPLRAACFTAAAVFLAHGLVDVSAHRFGTVMPVLFVFSLSLGSPQSTARTLSRLSFGTAQVLGILLVLVGLAWTCSSSVHKSLLPSSRSAHYQLEAQTHLQSGQLREAAQNNTDALRYTLLRWPLYFQRAQIDLSATPPAIHSAALNFRRARFLEPFTSSIAMAEAEHWIDIAPAFALAAWREAIDRATPEKIFDLFNEIITKSNLHPNLIPKVKEIAESRPDLNLIYWQRSLPKDFNADLHRRLEAGENFANFSHDQKKVLFALWVAKGDLGLLEATITAHPEWQRYAWRGLAREAARRQDYERAWKLVTQYGTAPHLPGTVDSRTLAELQKLFYLNPNDTTIALALYQRQSRQGLRAEALETIQQALKQKGTPSYFLYIQARLLAETGQWQRAWESWEQFESTLKDKPF